MIIEVIKDHEYFKTILQEHDKEIQIERRQRTQLIIRSDYKVAYGMGEKFNALNQKGKTVQNQVIEKFCNQNEASYFVTPFFVTDQDGLILPENIHGTMRTDINLDKFLKYGYLSKQLREALMYQKMYGGTNPPPSVTATSQIVSPFGDVVIAVDPVLLATTIPYGAPEQVNSAAITSSVAQVAKEIATTATDSMTVPATTMADLTTPTPAITTTVDTPVGTIDDSAYNMPAGTIESFDTNATKILLFFSPHCGYCADFMKQNGIWQSVKESVTPYVDIVEVNSDVNPQLCREFNVSYFPCLMKIKNNNVYEFTDARTFVNVKNFIMH